jgi:hypothetical protein
MLQIRRITYGTCGINNRSKQILLNANDARLNVPNVDLEKKLDLVFELSQKDYYIDVLYDRLASLFPTYVNSTQPFF